MGFLTYNLRFYDHALKRLEEHTAIEKQALAEIKLMLSADKV